MRIIFDSFLIINLFLIKKFLFFRATEFECCCFFVKEHNIKVESAIRLIFFSSQPVRLQIFCMLAIIRRYCSNLWLWIILLASLRLVQPSRESCCKYCYKRIGDHKMTVIVFTIITIIIIIITIIIIAIIIIIIIIIVLCDFINLDLKTSTTKIFQLENLK